MATACLNNGTRYPASATVAQKQTAKNKTKQKTKNKTKNKKQKTNSKKNKKNKKTKSQVILIQRPSRGLDYFSLVSFFGFLTS